MHDVSRRQIEFVAGMQREKRSIGIGRVLAAVDEGLVASNDRGGITGHDPGGAFILRDRQHVGILRHDGVREIRQSLARHDVLIDPDATEICEPLLVSRIVHDEIVVRRSAAHEKITKNRCAGGRATDNAASGQHVAKRLLRLGTGVVIDEMKLAAALKPDAAGLSQDRDERVGVGELSVGRVVDVDVLCAILASSRECPERPGRRRNRRRPRGRR